MDAFVGKWQLFETNNFEDYMKELGVGIVLRKMANQSKPVLDVTVTDGVTHIKSTTTFKTTEFSFTVGVEFEETTPDDKKVKSIVVKESDTKFVHTQKRELDNIIIRELIDDQIVMNLEYNGVKSLRKYKKVD